MKRAGVFMTDVLILAAGAIKHKLTIGMHLYESPALLPINTKCLASYLVDFYLKFECNIFLAVNESDLKQVKSELSYYADIKYISIRDSKGVVETLRTALPETTQDTQDIIINVVTTIPKQFPAMNEVQIDMQNKVCSDWSSIAIENKKISFQSKSNKDAKKHAGYAFTGIFRTEKNNIIEVLSGITNPSDLLYVVEKLHPKIAITYNKVDWIDCGHEANYFDARAKIIESRAFNKMSIDSFAGTITKISENVSKFCNEIRYVNMLPREISIYYPRVLSDLKVTDKEASVEMEYYGYPSVAEYMLYWQLDEFHWQRLFERIEAIIKRFSNYKYSIGQKAFLDCYVTKTIERVNEFIDSLPESYRQILLQNEIKVNGQDLRNFNKMLPEIQTKSNSLYSENDFCIVHGDLCFNNILYDLRSGIVRLVDARGSFGPNVVGIYGDIKYDLAKFTHSAIGHYDFIVNNLFECEIKENGINYCFNTRECVPYIKELCNTLVRNFGYKINDIYFIVGLLFVSMCPLHRDDLKRQLTMYAHGIKYLNSALQEDL